MVIQSKALPFEIQIQQYKNNIISTDKEFVFAEKMDELKDVEEFVQLKENNDLWVNFIANDKNAKLFIDGFEVVVGNDFIIEKENEIYLLPTENFVKVFEYNNFPLHPGVYYIKVTVEKKEYYAGFEIAPLHIRKTDWQMIKEDLEKSLKGFAQDLVRRHLVSQNMNDTYNSMPNHLLYQFNIIDKNFSRVMMVLDDLKQNANFRIKKEYVRVLATRMREIDKKTIMYKLQYPDDKNHALAPIKSLNYNLPENQYVKKIISELKIVLKKFSESLFIIEEDINCQLNDVVKYNVNKVYKEEREICLNNIQKYKIRTEQMRYAINIIEKAEWYQEVDCTTCNNQVSMVLFLDSRYRILYKLSKELKNREYDVDFDISYSYQWKRTDKLYEMWGFLKILEILTSETIGFQAIDGWIYGKKKNHTKNVFLSLLLPNTRIKLQKDNITINLVYDGVIPQKGNQTNLEENPIFLRSEHNKPDFRMDIYKKNIYIGSLLGDFKYRKPHSFFYESSPNNSRQQLRAYSCNCKSNFLHGDFSNKIDLGICPVKEVWAIYPCDDNRTDGDIDNDDSLRLLKLCPGKENEIGKYFNKILESYISSFDFMCK